MVGGGWIDGLDRWMAKRMDGWGWIGEWWMMVEYIDWWMMNELIMSK